MDDTAKQIIFNNFKTGMDLLNSKIGYNTVDNPCNKNICDNIKKKYLDNLDNKNFMVKYDVNTKEYIEAKNNFELFVNDHNNKTLKIMNKMKNNFKTMFHLYNSNIKKPFSVNLNNFFIDNYNVHEIILDPKNNHCLVYISSNNDDNNNNNDNNNDDDEYLKNMQSIHLLNAFINKINNNYDQNTTETTNIFFTGQDSNIYPNIDSINTINVVNSPKIPNDSNYYKQLENYYTLMTDNNNNQNFHIFRGIYGYNKFDPINQ